MIASKTTRREFIESAGRIGAGAGALLAISELETASGFAANDTIEVGCIGTGGRCRTLMKSLAQIPGVRISAVCDIYEPHREQARKLADPQAYATAEFREILDRKDIDAVLIGSPDHWHVPMMTAACDAGKDVYVEKPLTHNLAEGPGAIDAQNRNRRIVQVGTQQRSMPHFQKGKELIEQDRVGRIFKVHLTWNRNQPRMKKVPLNIDPKAVNWKAFLGNAPDQPFDEYRFRNWRWFWDFGGGILTDLMVHYIDVVHWFLEADHPTRATAIGNQVVARGIWETPDTIQCLLAYPDDLEVYFEGTFSNARNGAMLEFMGTDATLYLDRGRYELHPEPGKGGKPEEWILGSNPRRGADFYDKPDGELLHLTNWVECVRSRRRPNCPVEEGVKAAAAAHLGNRAFRSGQVADWA
jgi:predicted dehydrogenase